MKAYNRKRKPKYWTKAKWDKSGHLMTSRYSKIFCRYIDPTIKLLIDLMTESNTKNKGYDVIFHIENIKKYKESLKSWIIKG